MFCEKCGEQINNEAKFCPNCGASTDVSTPIINSSISKKSLIEKIKARKLPITIAAVILILAIVIISIVSFFNGRISLDDYINFDNVIVTGYDGYGKMDYNNLIDYEGLAIDLGEHKYEGHWIDDDVSVEGIDEFLEDAIKIDISDTEDFSTSTSIENANNSLWSNGDNFTINITVNYDYVNKFNFEKKLVGSKDGYKKSYTVSTLEKPITIDAFDMVKSATYDLTNSTAEFAYNKKYEKDYNGYKVKFEKGDYVDCLVVFDSYGDEIIRSNFHCNTSNSYSETGSVTLSVSGTNFIDEYGIVISPSEKEYKPTEIDFMTNVSQLSKNDYESVKKQAQEYIKNSTDRQTKFETSFFVSRDGSYRPNGIVFVYSDNIDGEKEYKYLAYEYIKVNKKTNAITNIDDLSIDRNFFYDDSIDDVKKDFSDYKITSIKF